MRKADFCARRRYIGTMSDLYPLDVLRLAAGIERTGRLDAPGGSATRVSRVCGSVVTVDVALDEGGRIADLAVAPEACALGQASAAVLAAHGIGAGRAELQAARDGLYAMLKHDGPAPEGRFAQLARLEAARAYPARHGRPYSTRWIRPSPAARRPAARPERTRAVLKHPALWLLRLYRATLSPMLYFFGVRCRHEPTCSGYAMDAIGRHGLWAGGWMTLARLQRCHPWGSHGLDPAPERLKATPLWAPWRHGSWSWSSPGGPLPAGGEHPVDEDESHGQGHAS